MTYGSYYEITTPLSTVKKQHFVEWFSGESYDSKRWTLISSGTAPTVAMQDSVDGGILMTNSQSGNGGVMIFSDNTIKQYAGLCSIIMILRNTTANGYTYAGWSSTGYGGTGASNNTIAMIEMGASTYYNLVFCDDSAWGRTATSIATADPNWHTVKIDIESASTNLTVDGILEATKSGQPYRSGNPRVQPALNGRHAGSNSTTYVRYVEAYNR